MQNCLSILGFLDAVYSVLQKSIPYRVLLYVICPVPSKYYLTKPIRFLAILPLFLLDFWVIIIT
ncbi:MAG: hypothetical protein ACRY3E_04715 [Candidatus Lariskella arthropodorum]